MPLQIFHEVLLNPLYTDYAKVGPEFYTAKLEVQSGIDQRNISRYDPIWKGEIDYSSLKTSQLEDLLRFFNCRWGMAYGFRFKPPYGRTATQAKFGTAVAGTYVYPLYFPYTSGGIQYRKRIVKPVGPGLFDFNEVTARANTCSIYIGAGHTLVGTATVDSFVGRATFTNHSVIDSNAGADLFWSGDWDLPMTFDTDHFKPNVDTSTVSDFSGLPLAEILPIRLGVTD